MGQTTPVSGFQKWIIGDVNGRNWCGTGGAGVSNGNQDWSCMTADYNYMITGNTWSGNNYNPFSKTGQQLKDIIRPFAITFLGQTCRTKSMIVAGSLQGFLQWLPLNGAPGHAGAQVPLGRWFDLRNNNYCGPGGAGVPLNGNDWACAVHDYNYNILGAAGKPFAAWTGTGSILENGVLAQANKNLVNNVDNSAEGRVIRMIFATRRF